MRSSIREATSQIWGQGSERLAQHARTMRRTGGAPLMATAGAALGDARAKRVLVVDDDNAVRTMLLVVLEAADYDARGVADGGEALSVAAAWRPDVILLDLLMPRMSG